MAILNISMKLLLIAITFALKLTFPVRNYFSWLYESHYSRCFSPTNKIKFICYALINYRIVAVLLSILYDRTFGAD